ncbi:uncharacterized protein N7459_002994 [Penicillium hispanicum]|uniref:uncharacterized protein n=1 Tax=Penicillium hispanicum TaxID=1080232 RepID=UPI002540F33D|nr:uncharacterized protein N7459_002994 [Penicillium hispanicum]KAJ5587229.1 hypothetical protein N7459_002994 [Penicillium hispanicum]
MPSYWCNVFLSCQDSYLNDSGLLRKIQCYIQNRKGSITAHPADRSHDHCVSIPLEICSELTGTTGAIADSMFDMAYDKLDQWMRDLPHQGLPFCRHHAFH